MPAAEQVLPTTKPTSTPCVSQQAGRHRACPQGVKRALPHGHARGQALYRGGCAGLQLGWRSGGGQGKHAARVSMLPARHRACRSTRPTGVS